MAICKNSWIMDWTLILYLSGLAIKQLISIEENKKFDLTTFGFTDQNYPFSSGLLNWIPTVTMTFLQELLGGYALLAVALKCALSRLNCIWFHSYRDTTDWLTTCSFLFPAFWGILVFATWSSSLWLRRRSNSFKLAPPNSKPSWQRSSYNNALKYLQSYLFI